MIARHTLFFAICCICAISEPMAVHAVTSVTDPMQDEINPVPMKGTQERGSLGNPLWAIPLRSLSATRDRPIFSPTRRPPAPAIVALPSVAPPAKAAAPPPVPEHSNLKLVGTVVSDAESIGVFIDQSSQIFVRLKTGEAHSGWILRSVKAREATLEKEDKKETLHLPTPKEGVSDDVSQ
jgi:general secretion pathway protein N